MQKKIRILLVAVVCLTVIGAYLVFPPNAACAGTVEGTEEVYKIKIASPAPPVSIAQTALEYLKKNIEERTNGRIEVSIFPGAQHGEHREVIVGVQSGAIEMAIFSSTWISTVIPEFI